MPLEQIIEQPEHTDTRIWSWGIYIKASSFDLDENHFQDEHNTTDETEYRIQFGDVETHIDDLISLHENWDSYNANTINDSTINRAKRFIHDAFFIFDKKGKSLSRPHVVPCPNGSIQFEWHIGEKEIEILIPHIENRTISYLKVENDHFQEGEVTDSYEFDALFE